MGKPLLNRVLAFALGWLLCLAHATLQAQETPLSLPPQASPPSHTLGLPPLALDPSLEPLPAQDPPQDPDADDRASPDEAPGEPQDEDDPRNRRKVYNGAYLLYFYQHDPVDQETLFHILGLYWHRDNPRWTLDVVAPLVGHWRWKDDPKHYGFATPLLWHHDAPDFTYTGSWLWHSYEDPQSSFDLLFPIYWRFQDHAQHDDLHIVGPAFWRQRPARWDAGLLPLLWGSGSDDELQWTILPLLLYYQDSPLTTKLVSPLFFYAKDHADQVTRGGSLPLLSYWSVDHDTEEDFFIQFPLFLQYRDRRQGETLRFLTPLLFGYEHHPSEGQESSFSTFFPLYFGYEDPRESFRLFLPLLYARADEGDDFRFRMLGPLYSWRSGEDTSWGLWPLFTFAQDWLDTDGDGQTDALEEATRLFPISYAYDSPWARTRLFAPLLYAHVQTFDEAGDEDYAWRSLGPVFSSRSARSAWSGLFPLLWMYESLEEGEEEEDTLLFPLFYAHDAPQRSTRLLAPLLYFRDDDEARDAHTLVVGPFYDARQGQDRDVGLAPLFFHHERPSQGERLTLVPGLFLHRETPDSLTQQWGPSWRHQDPDTEAWGVFPLLAYQEDLKNHTWGVFSLPGIYASAGPDRFHLLLGPAWSFQDGEELSQGLFPLALRTRRADGSGFRWLPGFLDIESAGGPGEAPWRLTWFLTGLRYHQQGQSSFSMVAPLYLQREDLATGDWSLWAFPWVVASGNEGEGILSVNALPFLYERDPASTFWSVLPLAFGGHTHDTSWWLVAPLALRHAQQGADPHDLLLGPLLFGRYQEGSQARLGDPEAQDQPEGSDTGWVGPYAWRDDRTSRLRLLAPLLWSYDDFEAQESTFVLFPLRLDWERTEGQLTRSLEAWTPLYLRYRETLAGQDLTDFGALGPVFSYEGEHGHGFGLFPLFWHDRLDLPEGQSGHDLLFPLVWHFFDERDDTRTTLVGPFYSTRDRGRSRLGLAPLYFHGREQEGDWSSGYDAVFPLLWSSFERGPGQDNATVVTPVGFHQRYAGQSSGLWLNYYYAREEDRSLDVVFPLFWREASPDLTRTALFPLFYRSEDRLWDETWTWAGPYVGHRSKELDVDLVLPLYYQEREADGSHLRLAPLFWDQRWGQTDERFTLVGPLWRWSDPRNDASTLGLFPLLWWSQDPQSTQSALLPLWFGDFSEQGHLATAAGLFWSWSNRWDQHEDGGWIAGPLYHTHAQDQERSASSAGLFPLAHWQQDSQDRARAWLLPVAYYDRDPQEGRRTVIAGPLFFHEDEQQDKNWWGVAPLLWGFREGQDSGSALFPLYYHEGRPQGHTFVSPVAASWREDDEYARWFLLYGAGGDARGSWQGVFPLFYGSQKADGAGLDVVVPLFAQWQSAGAQSGGKVLFPLYWNFYDRAAQQDATVLFPLYWSFQDPKRDLTLVLPWFHSERKDVHRVTHGLIPLYYYSEDKYGYTFQLLGGLYGVDHVHKTQESDYQILWIPF